MPTVKVFKQTMGERGLALKRQVREPHLRVSTKKSSNKNTCSYYWIYSITFHNVYNNRYQFCLRKTGGVGTQRIRYKTIFLPSLFYIPSGTSFAYAKLEASERSPFGINLIFYRRHYSVGLFLKDLLSKIAWPSPISCSINARAFNGRPNNVINPSASLWL